MCPFGSVSKNLIALTCDAVWTVELGRAIRRHFLASLCLSLLPSSFVITLFEGRWSMEATSQSLPRVFRTGSSTDGRSVSPALSALLPSSSWNGLLTTDSVSAAAIYPSRFLFEPKMSNDSSHRRRRRLFPLAFQHFSGPHRLNLRERAGSVFALRRPIDALLSARVLKCACLLPTSNSSPSSAGLALQSLLARLPRSWRSPTPIEARVKLQFQLLPLPLTAALKEGETRTREER